MAYDKTKEVVLREIGVFPIDRRDNMTFRIATYDGGPPKLYCVKTWPDKTSGADRFSTSRYTREQARNVAKLIAQFADDDGNWT